MVRYLVPGHEGATVAEHLASALVIVTHSLEEAREAVSRIYQITGLTIVSRLNQPNLIDLRAVVVTRMRFGSDVMRPTTVVHKRHLRSSNDGDILN
jgi:hypothetical protein